MQGLTEAAGQDVRVSFTPHLMPMARGMQSTIYVRLTSGTSAADLRTHLQARPTHRVSEHMFPGLHVFPM